MPTVAIEICDAGVALVRSREAPVESAGYALLREGQPPALGAAAYAKARLSPRFVHSRFWDQLSLQPLAQPVGELQTLADLASAHLLDLWQRSSRGGSKPEEALLVVPGHYALEQLGVLLGILENAGIPVAGMVDAAVAAVVTLGTPPPTAETLHLDVLLHRSVISQIELVEASWQLREAHSHRHLGLASASDSWAKFVAELFVRNTRFDPLHRAESEQALYDLLPRLLAQSAAGGLQSEGKLPVEMRAGDHTHRVSLDFDQLSRAARGQYRRLITQIENLRSESRPLRMLLSSRAASMPGLRAMLSELRDCEVVALPAAAAGFGALAREQEIRSDDGVVRLVKTLRHLGESTSQQAAEVVSQTHPATHLLFRNRAYALGVRPLHVLAEAGKGFCSIGVDPPSPSTPHLRCVSDGEGAWVESRSLEALRNGQLLTSRTHVQRGDRIRCESGGEELRLIAVVPPDGA